MERNKISSVGCATIKGVWGNVRYVAMAACNEMLLHRCGFPMERGEEVNNALTFGIMAEEMKQGTPEAFIARIEDTILNK